MAEAAFEDSTMNRFFCHKCSIEIPRVLEDYTCPTCLGGFIEELDSTATSSDEPSDEHSDDDMDDLAQIDLFHQFGDILFGLGNGASRGATPGAEEGAQGGEETTGAPSVPRRAHAVPLLEILADLRFLQMPEMLRDRGGNTREPAPIEHMIQDFIVNLTGVGWGPMGPGGRGNGPVFFLGNPGDYAWGREGLDAIVTQLLNQMDVTGPPPLDKEKIKEIPTTEIQQEQVDMNLQCSVCWEDFKIGENVRKLECEHFYHEPCIIPWLELHGTCPICRKSLSSDGDDKNQLNPGQSGTMPDLAAILRAANRSASGSSGSSSGSTSSDSTTPRAPPQPPQPPSDFHMDFEFD